MQEVGCEGEMEESAEEESGKGGTSMRKSLGKTEMEEREMEEREIQERERERDGGERDGGEREMQGEREKE